MQRLRSLRPFARLAVAGALLAAGAASAAPQAAATARPRIDVVFVLDTTGSMSGLIEGAKRKIWSIANRLASTRGEPDVRMGLVGYRDRGDDYVTRRLDLTDDIDAVHAALQAFAAGGGGDTPESVNQALHEAVTAMHWRPDDGVYRVVFLVGDAPPHADYPDDVPWTATLSLAAKRGIVVNAVQCGEHAGTAQVWREIALRGEGDYARIDADGGMTTIAAPQDEELARLQRELAATALPWGSAEEQASLAQKLESATAAAPSVAADRLGYLHKAGGRVVAGRGDLVDAARAGEVDPAALPESELPPSMRGMDGDERRAYVEAKRAERERLETRAAALSNERDAWLRAETERLAREGGGDGFDARVFEAVRRQAAEVGIAYE